MYPELDFYQVSGHRAHSHIWFKKYDDKPLVQAIISMEDKLFRPGGKDSPVELVLGILSSGASYLLMTSEQMHKFTHRHRLQIPRNPRKASDYLSLSPIYFNSFKELSDKIAMYKYRTGNVNTREPGVSQDRSKANRGYVLTGSGIVHYRGYFEQQRTLYKLLTRELEPGKVGLTPPPWLGGVRVVSLVFGDWTIDKRTRKDRLNDPLLVDVGWTDVLFPSFFEQLSSATVHLKLKNNRNNPSTRDPRLSEVVEDDESGLSLRLRDLLNHDAKQSGKPLIVLVHDEDMARSVLSRAGINLDSWSSGLSNLLPLPSANRRKVENTSNTTVILTPYLVDMQKLVKAVMEANPGHTVPHSAKVLHMQTDTKTCAGDDSLLLLRMWTSMAQGLAIDEQHKERSSHQPTYAQLLAPQAQAQATSNPDANADPNDADPNDMPPDRRPTVVDDFSDDDDW